MRSKIEFYSSRKLTNCLCSWSGSTFISEFIDALILWTHIIDHERYFPVGEKWKKEEQMSWGYVYNLVAIVWWMFRYFVSMWQLETAFENSAGLWKMEERGTDEWKRLPIYFRHLRWTCFVRAYVNFVQIFIRIASLWLHIARRRFMSWDMIARKLKHFIFNYYWRNSPLLIGHLCLHVTNRDSNRTAGAVKCKFTLTNGDNVSIADDEY